MPEAQWGEWWARHGATPEREAHDYLGRLPIGPLLPDGSGARAGTLVDGFSIVCTGPMAFVAGLDAVSLLQARLVELREATALVLMD